MGERLIVRKEDGVFTRCKAVYIEISGNIWITLDEYSLVAFQKRHPLVFEEVSLLFGFGVVSA